MNERLQRETENLKRSWTRHDDTMLRNYLVSGVEDPRINIQSILTRHFLIAALFGSQFDELTDAEVRFAVSMNWLLRLNNSPMEDEDFRAIHHALIKQSDEADGTEIPHFILDTFAALPTQCGGRTIPNYLDHFLTGTNRFEGSQGIHAIHLNTFQSIWSDLLARQSERRIRVLEPACGSANDYRGFADFGLAKFLDYSGFDLCEKNILNAREMFPGIRFEPGNTFQIEAEDQSFDHCCVHDLFEHLSIEGMEVAVSEIRRVTKTGICASFFQMDEIPDHIVRPADDYHWNKLSMAKTKALFEDRASDVQVMHIDTFLRMQYGFADTHNKDAYMFLVSF